MYIRAIIDHRRVPYGIWHYGRKVDLKVRATYLHVHALTILFAGAYEPPVI